jgi:hypothetical protein
MLHSQLSYHNASGNYQDYDSMTYANNTITGATTLGVDVPPQLQEAFVDMHGKAWPDFEPSYEASVVSGSSCVELQEMDNKHGSVSWSLDSVAEYDYCPGGYLYGIGAQFER